MARARGANAVMAGAFETTYGVPPTKGFYRLAFTSSAIGDEQKLLADDTLGNGRDPAAPSLDVINNEGDVSVPVDLRGFGFWLKLLFGAPATTAGVAASGSIVFSDQPVAGSSIDVNGTAFAFGADIAVGTTLKDTVTNAVIALNASTAAGVAAATYEMNADGVTIEIVYDAVGVDGNAFTLSVSADPKSNATVSGATLSGGAAAGAYNHVFKSGALELPSASIEIGNPDVPSYAMNYGLGADKLAIQYQRSGLLNATVSCVAQGEKPRTVASAAGALTALDVVRFSQFTGKVMRSGVSLGDLVSGNLNYSNGLDKAEDIREDGRIDGWDAGQASMTGQCTLRFKDTTLMNLATDSTPIDLVHQWKISATQKLRVVCHKVYLPKPKLSISGPGGIQVSFDWQGAKSTAVGRMATVTLVNDVEAY